MEKITSFTIDHNVLEKGFYLSRVDGNVYTYDLRFKKPNNGDYLHIAAMHTIEHLFATVVRNSEHKDKIVYFGPMGCRTGFYLLVFDMGKAEAMRLTRDCVAQCLLFDEIPGSKKIECGNYRSHNLKGAKEELAAYLEVLNDLLGDNV